MSHLQLAPGALHTYVSDSYVDQQVLHTILNTLKVFNNFKAGHQVAWGRPTIVTQPASFTSQNNLTSDNNSAPYPQEGSGAENVTGGITVKVGYYAPSGPTGQHALSSLTIMQLRTALSEVCQQPVMLIVTRLSGPYMDATVLSHYLAREFKTKKFGRVINRMLGTIGTVANATPITTYPNTAGGVQLPASLVGVQVSVHGRLSAEPARPRMTEERIVVGSLTANDQQVLDSASTTAINKKNVYTVKVMLTHRLLTDG
jgi:hypothetical protein